jgi:hypothetical protein
MAPRAVQKYPRKEAEMPESAENEKLYQAASGLRLVMIKLNSYEGSCPKDISVAYQRTEKALDRILAVIAGGGPTFIGLDDLWGVVLDNPHMSIRECVDKWNELYNHETVLTDGPVTIKWNGKQRFFVFHNDKEVSTFNIDNRSLSVDDAKVCASSWWQDGPGKEIVKA